MTEPTSNNTLTAQCAKAMRCSVIALLDKIKTAESITEAVKELSNLLRSTDKALERVTSLFDQPQSCIIKVGDQHHVRMVIWTNQDACERYQNSFTEWKNHSNDDSLRDSDTSIFDTLKDIESRLLIKRLRLFKQTIDQVMQTSALLTTFSASENISDKEWVSIRTKESSVLSAIIEANDHNVAYRPVEMTAERITCEFRGYGISMEYHRRVLDGLMAEFRQIQGGQGTDSRNQDQRFPSAISRLSDESQFTCKNMSIYRNGVVIARKAPTVHPKLEIAD